MRVIILVAWCVLLAGGAWYIGRRKPAPKPANAAAKPALTAARNLVVNWRIGDADIVAADGAAGKPWTGKYMARAVDAAKEVKPTDWVDEPKIAQNGTLTLYLLPLAAGAEKRLNAGSKIDVMEGRVPAASNVEVAAVRCQASCVAILQVSREAFERLRAAGAANFDWVLR